MTSTTTTRPAAGPRRSRRRGRRGAILTAVALAVALAGAGAWACWRGSIGTLPLRPHCTATALGNSTELSPEQAGNAAIIAAVAVQRRAARRAPRRSASRPRCRSRKLATSPAATATPSACSSSARRRAGAPPSRSATRCTRRNAFYDVLVKVEGYQDLPITTAAQTVQRSAFPAAYADHEPEARILASALTGQSPAGFSCVLHRVDDAPSSPQPASAEGFTPSAHSLAAAARREAGRTGKAVAGTPGAVRFSLGTGQDATASAWALAHWAVARADTLDVVRVETGGMVWDRNRPDASWTATAGAAGAGTVVVRTAGGASR